MNNINTILDAVGELDNTVLENAFKPEKKKPIALIVIAAAAALSLLVGFTVAIRNNVVFNGKPLFDYNIRIHDEVVIPSAEEMEEMGAYNFDFLGDSYVCNINADPFEVIDKFGLTPLGKDNFSMFVNKDNPDDAAYHMHIGVIDDLIRYEGRESSINLQYMLVDNKLGVNVMFLTTCFFDETTTQHSWEWEQDEQVERHEVIDLNNGENALLYTINSNTRTFATFTYDGIIYKVIAGTDIDGMKQILADLGITAE